MAAGLLTHFTIQSSDGALSVIPFKPGPTMAFSVGRWHVAQFCLKSFSPSCAVALKLAKSRSEENRIEASLMELLLFNILSFINALILLTFLALSGRF
jgi:hypothetical protein